MTNVTQGDLAYVTSACPAPLLKGLVVRVGRRCVDGDRMPCPSVPYRAFVLEGCSQHVAWWIRAARDGEPMPQQVHLRGDEWLTDFVDQTPMPDEFLRRIAGPGVLLDETTDTTTGALAPA